MEKEILSRVTDSCRKLNTSLNEKGYESWTHEETMIYAAALELRSLILMYNSSKNE